MEQKDLTTMFSHKTDIWATPQKFFDELDAEFHFTLDPCADAENHKCEKYYTEEDNGLAKDWSQDIVFVNPPYSKNKDWIKKCSEEAKKGATVVMLIPARTDTKIWWECIFNQPNVEIRFIKGRIKFEEKNLILEELKSVLDYNPDTGIFVWKKDIYAGKSHNTLLIKKGSEAGCLNHDYVYIKYNNKKYAAHRLAYLFMYGEAPKYIDHIDGNKSNNSISNLRACNKNQNGQNRPKMSNNTTGYKGVSIDKRNGKYCAQIRIDGKLKWIGAFNTPELAAKAYDDAAIDNFGEFANLNFEQETTDYGDGKNSAPFPSAVIIFKPIQN